MTGWCIERDVAERRGAIAGPNAGVTVLTHCPLGHSPAHTFLDYAQKTSRFLREKSAARASASVGMLR